MSVLAGHQKAFAALAHSFSEHGKDVMAEAGECEDPRVAAKIADRAIMLSSFSVVFGTASLKLDEMMKAETTGTDKREGR